VQNAFLHGRLKEDVYMRQPSRYVDSSKLRYVCKLDKALYGLKQWPRAWYSMFNTKLRDLGFMPSKVDTSLFMRQQVTMFLLVYVDDIIVTSSCPAVVDALLKNLSVVLALKELGHLHYFLGIQVIHNDTDVTLCQEKYAADLLEKVGMKNCNSVATPLSTSEKLSVEEGTRLGE
jgi:hypothetical protein